MQEWVDCGQFKNVICRNDDWWCPNLAGRAVLPVVDQQSWHSHICQQCFWGCEKRVLFSVLLLLMNQLYILLFMDKLEIWRPYCRWVLLEVLDKVSPGSVIWKQASKPPIKMPFRKVENCNQVIKLGKELNFSLVNVAGNDIVQGNKKLILGNYKISLLFSRIWTLHSFGFWLTFTNAILSCFDLLVTSGKISRPYILGKIYKKKRMRMIGFL